MRFSSLKIEEALDKLAKKFNIIVVENSVSTDLEISSIVEKFDNTQYVVVFKKLQNYPNFIGVANLLNSRQKLMYLLGVDSDEGLYRKILEAEEKCNGNIIEVSIHDFKEVEIDLRKLPIARYYPQEPCPYLTSGVVIGLLEKPDGTCVYNASIHRLSVLDRDKLVIRLVPRHLYTIWSLNREQGKDTRVAIVWTINPVLLLAAACSPPFGVFELRLVEPLCGTAPKVFMYDGVLPVPVDAEIVIIGRILRDEVAKEGPFVDVLRLYDEVRLQPVVKVEKILVRADRSYNFVHYLVPGLREHQLLMGIEKEAKIWKFVKNVVPEVRAVRLTYGSGGWLHAVISIRKNTDGDAKNAILAAFAAHPSLKHVVVVDEDIDVDDPSDVEWAIATRFRADRDLVVINYVRGSTLDPSCIDPESGLTCKVGIDATCPIAEKQKFLKARPHKTPEPSTSIAQGINELIK